MPTKTLKEHETTSEDEKPGGGSGDDDISVDHSSQSSGSSSDSSSSGPHVAGRVRSQSGQECVVEKSPKGRFHRFNRKLGSGSYKTVYLAFDNDTGREVAWNVISFAHLSRHERKRIDDEIKIAKSLDHDRIISFINAWINKKKEEVVFITERVNGGSLRQYINRLDGPLKVKVIRMWCKQILEGINYLHNQLKVPVIHRDLKCDNIFINGSDGKVLIGDLGLSTALQHASVATSIVGTPEFMAPELYEEKYGPPVDIYAFGMCLLEMVTRRFPYAECATPGQIYKKVINGEMPDSLERIQNKELKRIIEQCIQKEPAMRPTAAELLAMPYWDQKDDGDELATLEPLSTTKDDGDEGVNDESPSKEKGHRQRKARGLSNRGDDAPAVVAQPAVVVVTAAPEDRSASTTPRGSGEGIGRSDVSTVIHKSETRSEEEREDSQQQQEQQQQRQGVGSTEQPSPSIAASEVEADTESVKNTPSGVDRQKPGTPNEGLLGPNDRTVSAAVVTEPLLVPPAAGMEDIASDSSEAPQLISATTHIEAATSPNLTGGEAVIRRDVARRPPNEKVMAAVAAHDGTVHLPPEIEQFCRHQLGSDRVTKVVLLIETETDKFQRINFEYSLDEDTCDSIAEELLENNLVWREVNRDRLVQKIRQAVFMRVKQIALEEGIPLPAPVAAAIASSITSTTTAAKQSGGESMASPITRMRESQVSRVPDSPLSRPRTPHGSTVTVSEFAPTAEATSVSNDGDVAVEGVAAVKAAEGATRDNGPLAQPQAAINPQTYAAAAATVPTRTPTTTAPAPLESNLPTAVNVPSRPAPATVEPVEVEAAERPPAQGPAASPTTPANVVSPSNHVAIGSGKPPPAPRPASHAGMGVSGRHSHAEVPSMSGVSGSVKINKKASLSKYVPLTLETTAHLTNESVSGAGLEQVVPHLYKEVLNAELADSGQSGADSTASGRPTSTTMLSEVPIFPEIPPPLNDGHAPTEEDVAWVQIALAAVVPSVKLNAFPKLGVMCPGTVDAIKGFQEYHSLPVDGNMDDRTWQLLVDSLETRRQKIEEREAKRAEAKLKAKLEAERKRQARQAESAKAMDMMEKTLYGLSAPATAGPPSAASSVAGGALTTTIPPLHHPTSMVLPSQSPPAQHSSPSGDTLALVTPGTPPRQSAAAVGASSSGGGVGSQIPRSGSVPPTVSPWVAQGAKLPRTVSYTGTPPSLSRNASLPNVVGTQAPQQMVDVFHSLRRVSPTLSEAGSQQGRAPSASHSPPAERRSLYSAPDSYSTTSTSKPPSTYQPPMVTIPSGVAAAAAAPVTQQQQQHVLAGNLELNSEASSVIGSVVPEAASAPSGAGVLSTTSASLDELLTANPATTTATTTQQQHPPL